MADSKQMVLDVKLDLKDGKSDLCYLRNWVKCYVKIEAIECFPCYLKISFFYQDDNAREYPFSVIRINIPGVRVETAASRTKAIAYGVFWKNNRKRCKLFFAFEDKEKCIDHMNWLKNSIDSLEDYRKKILENHRISRSVISKQLENQSIGRKDSIEYEVFENNMNNEHLVRDLNDVLGPLPAIPTSNTDINSRWSIRRVSGYSGIYEEILDPANKSSEKSRESIASGIYVDMMTPIQPIIGENIEMPPPLPPRRRLISQTHSDFENDVSKSRKSSWNLISVFGRSKCNIENTATTPPLANIDLLAQQRRNSPIQSIAQFTKNKNISIVTKSRSEHQNLELLSKKQNSFSSPDLTNIADVSEQHQDDLDDVDLDIMDIERSNSLNSSGNQFLCRSLALNISSNILWSHNLSSTLSSSCDSSAINLVGANINTERFLREDLSGYCLMAPILKNNSTTNESMEIKSEKKNGVRMQQIKSIRLIDNSSGYCHMAPILKQDSCTKITHSIPKSTNFLVDKNEITKNITFERKYELEEDSFSLSDFSLLSNEKHSSNRASLDETSSSGVSSDDGNIYATNSLRLNSGHTTNLLNQSPSTNITNKDNVSSLTNAESPNINSEILFPFYSTKFDDKYPSYFPNASIGSPNQEIYKNPLKMSPKNAIHSDTNKCLTDAIYSTRKPLYERQKQKKSELTLSTKEKHINFKKSNYKNVIKSPPVKVQKLKQRKSSIENIYVGSPSNAITGSVKKNQKNSENCKFRQSHANYKNNIKQTFESKKVLTHIDPNTKPSKSQSHHNFDKNAKITSAASSPRRIYNKCATLATRLKTPPLLSTDPASDSMASGGTTKPHISKSYSFAIVENPANQNVASTGKTTDISAGGLMRFASLTRLKKIDFSPLKFKINNILQRTNAEM